jgi:pheromone shutdown-related protein TraB
LENIRAETASSSAQCEHYTAPPGLRAEAQAHEIVIVGTAHVSEKSVQEVTRTIEEMRPEIVAVELCPARYRALTGQEEEQEIKISELLSGGNLYYLLVQWFLAYVQKKIGEEMGVKPGSEMLAAAEAAQRVGARVVLVDRDVGITMQRFWSAMGIVEKIKLIYSLITASLGWGEEDIDIDTITQDDVVSQMISEFRKISPSAANVLVDERDAYISRNLLQLSSEGRTLAVVGAGHKEGIARYMAHPEQMPAMEDLKERHKKRISLATAFGALVTLLVAATLVLIFAKGYSSHNLMLAFGIWFLVTGGLSGLGVVLARGHPLSALTAFLVAWMTTLNPLVAAGWFAGMVEAWKLKPTVSDLRRLAAAESFGDMMENRLFRVILVAALANLGAMAGTFVGIYLIWQRLGLIDPAEMLKGIL